MHRNIRVLVLLAGVALLAGCTQLTVTPDVTQPALPPTVEASTFGSGDITVDLDEQGRVDSMALASDGTNIMSIFTGLFKTAARFFGGGAEAPVVNVHMPPATVPEITVTNPYEVAPTP